jgi:hypothetical protein
MKLRLMLLLCAALAVTVGVTAASSATTTTIGQTSATANYTCAVESDLQTGVASGTSFEVPAGNWIVTSWSTYAGSAGGSMSAMIFRPAAAPGSYTVVGESAVASPTPSVLNTFPVNIHVQGGDFLGLWGDGSACATITGNDADVNPYLPGPQPAVGATVFPTPFPDFLINISATLIPALPTSKDDCKNAGWQVYGVFKNQGDCVSFVATGGKNPPAGG